jgi:hypothetical protein
MIDLQSNNFPPQSINSFGKLSDSLNINLPSGRMGFLLAPPSFPTNAFVDLIQSAGIFSVDFSPSYTLVPGGAPPETVPEPSELNLMVVGLLALGLRKKMRHDYEGRIPVRNRATA